MKKLLMTCALAVLSLGAAAEPSGDPSLNDVLDAYSKNHNMKILAPVFDAPVRLYGLKFDELDYEQLLTLLAQYNQSIVQYDDFYVVTEFKFMRSSSIRTVQEGEHYAPSEVVSDVLVSEKLCTRTLLPIIRPLVPQHAHLASAPIGRAMVITDKYANIQRIAALIAKLDANTPEQKKCDKPVKKDKPASKD